MINGIYAKCLTKYYTVINKRGAVKIPGVCDFKKVTTKKDLYHC